MRSGSMRAAVGLALLTWSAAGRAASQDGAGAPTLSTFAIDDVDPEASMPSPEEAARAPLQMGYLMVDITRRAEEALAQGQPAKAARYFRAMTRAAPDRALPFRKACAAHQTAGEVGKAVEMCRAAARQADATADDRFNFLKLALEKPGRPTPAELRDIDATVARLGQEFGRLRADKTRRGLAEVKCQVAARLGDATRLAACTHELRSLHVDQKQLLPYAWALAISQGDLSKAESVKDQAIRSGLPAPDVAVMVRGIAQAREQRRGPWLTAAKRWWPAALAGALALVAAAALQRKRRAAAKLPPAA